MASLLSCAAFTVVSPFYSKVATDQGMAQWLIGAIISTPPLFSLICSYILPKYLQFIGRTKVLVFGQVLIGVSNIILAFVPYTSPSFAIFISFFSRTLAGSGSALSMITSYATLTSDYPEDITKIIATIEIVSGVGLIIGPAVGSIMFTFGGFFYSCVLIGVFILIYAPILYCIVGPSKKYLLSEDKINLVEVALKPVKFT